MKTVKKTQVAVVGVGNKDGEGRGSATSVLDTANVIPAWFGATSAWLLKCPDEFAALNPIESDTKLKTKTDYVTSHDSIYGTDAQNRDEFELEQMYLQQCQCKAINSTEEKHEKARRKKTRTRHQSAHRQHCPLLRNKSIGKVASH